MHEIYIEIGNGARLDFRIMNPYQVLLPFLSFSLPSPHFSADHNYAFIFPNYNQQDTTFLSLFISTDALHVSGGSSAHHQEHKTVHTASDIVNKYCCLLLLWMRWNCVNVSVGILLMSLWEYC